MQRDSFTKALRSTAKIACAASLLHVGCRNKTPAEVAEPSTTETSKQLTEDTEIPNDTSTADTNEDPDSGSTPDSDYEECQPIIEAEFADGSFPMADEVPQEVKDCCALTAAYYDALLVETDDFNIIMEWEHRDQCCSALEWSNGSTACTPWGPPTPPSAHKMKRSILVHQRIMVS